MESISQLFLLLEDLLLVGQAVPQGNVLQSVLVHLLILERVHLLPLVQHLLGDLLASPREDSILSNTTLELFELGLNLVALGLLLIQL